MEHLKSQGVPFAVSCALHVGLVAGLILTQHWVSGAVVLHPPVVPVQLVTLDTPKPTPPPVAPEPPRAPVKPPRLLERPRPAKPPVTRREEPPPAPPPVARREEPPPPIAPPPAPTPPPAPPAPAPAAAAAGDPSAPVAGSAATSAPSSSASASVSSPSASPTTARREAAAAPSGPSGPRTAAVTPPGITQYARPQGGYQVRPDYPATARRLGVQGTTLLRVHVLADGHIGDVLVAKSAGHPDLDEAAAEAVKRWRFDPARRGKEAVAMWVLLPVEFRLR